MYIKKVEITNIRSIDQFEMTFDTPAGWHVLIGDNGAGKSTILRSIALALIGGQQAAGLREDWKVWLKKGEIDGRINLDLVREPNFDLTTYAGVVQGQRSLPGPIDFENFVNLEYKDDIKTVKLQTHIESFSLGYRFNWDNYYGFFSASFGPYRRFTGGSGDWNDIFENPQLNRLGAHLTLFNESIALTETTKWLMKLQFQKLEQKNNHLDSIKDLINSPDFLPNETKLYEINSDGVTFIDRNGSVISVNELSDGFRSILSLTFELLRLIVFSSMLENEVFLKTNSGQIFVNVPGVVLIDEIDAHLHPTWQARIGQWFTKYFPKIQFIVTTHSPLVCRACEDGTIWRLASPNKSSISRQVTGTEKDRLIFGNILDAYGTEIFGKSAVRSVESGEKLERLGKLNMLFALDKISAEEEKERLELQKILSTDDPTGF